MISAGRYKLLQKMLAPYPVSRSEIEAVLPFFKEMVFKATDFIFREEEKGADFYLILKGEVEVSKRTSEEGERKVLAIKGAGDFFGEMSFFTRGERGITVRALVDTGLLVLSRDKFLELVGRCPQVAIFFLLSLLEASGRQLNEVNLELVTLYDFGRLMVNSGVGLEGLLEKFLSKVAFLLGCGQAYFILRYPPGSERVFLFDKGKFKADLEVEAQEILSEGTLEAITGSARFYVEEGDKLVVAVKNVNRKLLGMMVFLKERTLSLDKINVAVVVGEQLGSVIESFMGEREKVDKERLERKWF